jgi:hypothetical protein
MRKRYRELVLSSIAQRIRTEIGAPKALNARLVAALEGLKNLPDDANATDAAVPSAHGAGEPHV